MSSLSLRRRAPLAMGLVLGVMLVFEESLTTAPAHENIVGGVGAILFALFSLGAHARSLPRSAAGALAVVMGAMTDVVVEGISGDDFWYWRLIYMGGAWGAGYALRHRRLQVETLSGHAERLQREQEMRAAAAVAAERRRLARELHDVIAHNVSVMVVQAGAAAAVLDRDPQRARDPLRSIQESGRQAVVELRRLLGILREGDAELDVAVQPSVRRIDGLVEQMRDAGLDVSVRVEGAPQPLPTSIDLSAYRIVQEGLTNALKHAGASRVEVTIRYAEDVVELEVADDGHGRQGGDGAGGHGLVGMRERVTLFGGAFEAGNRQSGGFALRATLPMGGPQA
jgi:signal transduction histidine kinase